jgi:hypothetical protein
MPVEAAYSRAKMAKTHALALVAERFVGAAALKTKALTKEP